MHWKQMQISQCCFAMWGALAHISNIFSLHLGSSNWHIMAIFFDGRVLSKTVWGVIFALVTSNWLGNRYLIEFQAKILNSSLKSPKKKD
jgi:sulfite exporter TauE/SafE